MKKFVFFIISFFIFISNINALTIAPVDITNASISDLQSYVEKGYITYEDITRIYLDRINAYDSNYDSIISLNQNAIEEAREADKIYQVSGASSPLFGIPILVKDNIDVIGMPTTAGSSALSDSYPSKNAYVVQKLLDAGAIILGKTNMSQFAIKASSSMSSYGIVKNSFNTLYSSYGSSGGSAVAVSLGFAVASLGTDTNSSTRVPASANNVVGIRPSIGLVSRDGILPYDSFRDTVGIISKYVDDSSIILDAIEGYDENDYESKSVLLQDDPYSMDGTLEGINIGVMEDWIDESDDDIQDLTYKAINQLEENGANIIYLNDFYTDEMDDINMSISSSVNLCDSFNDYIKNTSSSIKTFNDLVNSPGNIYNLKNYLNTCNKSDYYSKPNFDKRLKLQSLISDSMDKFGVDIIVYPTLSSDVSKLSNINESNYKSYSSYLAPSAGMPSISVPMGFGRNGLPYGLEFMSTQFNESS
ncbi:MAG TPA: amidase, partial [Bacilli bacterium]|nr:amidase [Bacilli bacterium]